eukprot:GHUV01013550.1.p1 GENE.GHUV01013550.1~~GHUV01013550.1.p1  ORF type:complete len:337 (+),score=86.52 GHUV01013550.1:331-1341(+)
MLLFALNGTTLRNALLLALRHNECGGGVCQQRATQSRSAPLSLNVTFAASMHLCPSYWGQRVFKGNLANVYGSSACVSSPVPHHVSRTHVSPCLAASVDEPNQQLDDVAAETAARIGWDPAGILPPVEQIGTTDHFARRARQKLLLQQQQSQQPQGDGDGTATAHQQVEQPAAAAPGAAAAPAQAYSQAVRPQVALQQQQQAVQSSHRQQQQQTQPQQSSSSDPSAVQEQPVQPADLQPSPAATAFIANDPFERIPAKWLTQGGIPTSDTSAYDRQAFVTKLAEKFIPIDLEYPGLRIVNFDPAVFTVEGFMTSEECQSWQQHALDSGTVVGPNSS